MDKNELINQYGIYTFDKRKMKERLPSQTYLNYINHLDKNENLSNEDIKIIAEEMKKWALELGATHYTHWFSSLNGMCAEKHIAFLEPNGIEIDYKFNEEALLKGESDASSFPNGGLRSPYKARGYTIWDSSSISFVKDGTLYIPSLFYSYTGESLDYKSHLIKSNEILNDKIIELYKLFDIKINKVDSYVGVEQEYFLVKEESFIKRTDLKLINKTLFGSLSSKTQENTYHYFSPLEKNIRDFMKELDTTLWKYGIPSKIKHNEAAPNQFEIVCVYRKVKTTSDNNLLLMQLINEIAKKHHLRCIINEKPFKGINGSGKHNNWSLITDEGKNLFKPSSDILNDLPFLSLLGCLIKGIDEYNDLLKLSISSFSNEFRLGGNEAPPLVMSLCLGDSLNQVIDVILENKDKVELQDIDLERNRTSPFAFLGNRFEFRGVGSSFSLALVNTILNSILSYEVDEFIKEVSNKERPLNVIKKYIETHKRVIFEGDGYSSFWKEESLKRGLDQKDLFYSMLSLLDEKKVKPLLEQNIFSKEEISSLFCVLSEKYYSDFILEPKVFIGIINKEIFPFLISYINQLISTYLNLVKCNCDNKELKKIIDRFNNLLEIIIIKKDNIEKIVNQIDNSKETIIEKIKKYKDELLSEMDKLREIVDNIEDGIDKNKWPLLSYTDLLFSL